MNKLPNYLFETLVSITNNEGQDIEFALGYLGSLKHSYVSKLKQREMAYTHRHNGTVEVWAYDKGREHIKQHAMNPLPK